MTNCPTGKIRYMDRYSASRHVDRLRENERMCKKGCDKDCLEVYKCNLCTFYHVGNRREGIVSSSNAYVGREAS